MQSHIFILRKTTNEYAHGKLMMTQYLANLAIRWAWIWWSYSLYRRWCG